MKKIIGDLLQGCIIKNKMGQVIKLGTEQSGLNLNSCYDSQAKKGEFVAG